MLQVHLKNFQKENKIHKSSNHYSIIKEHITNSLTPMEYLVCDLIKVHKKCNITYRTVDKITLSQGYSKAGSHQKRSRVKLSSVD